MTDSPARVAADVASLLPADHPLARIARARLEVAVRSQIMAGPSTQVGTRLRDAAVDPRDDPYAPINAGQPGAQGNPHGLAVAAIEVSSPEYDHITDVLRDLRDAGTDPSSSAWLNAVQEARSEAARIMARRGKIRQEQS